MIWRMAGCAWPRMYLQPILIMLTWYTLPLTCATDAMLHLNIRRYDCGCNRQKDNRHLMWPCLSRLIVTCPSSNPCILLIVDAYPRRTGKHLQPCASGHGSVYQRVAIFACLCSHMKALATLIPRSHRALHAVDEVALFIEVLRQVESHVFLDVCRRRHWASVCAELAMVVEVVRIAIRTLAQVNQCAPLLHDFSDQLVDSSARFLVHVTIVVSLPCALRRRRSFRMSDAVGTPGWFQALWPRRIEFLMERFGRNALSLRSSRQSPERWY